MASTFNQLPGTHAHRLALTKLVSKNILRTQLNKMVDSVCDKADSILSKFKHSKLSYHELLESFQDEMAESNDHYRERLALEVDLVHKNVMAKVMDSIYARFEVIAKLNEKKMKDLHLVEKIPIGDTRDSDEQEQALDLSLKSHSTEPKASSSAVRKQVCFPPNGQIFQYDKTDSEDYVDDGGQSKPMMDNSNDSDKLLKLTIDGPEKTQDDVMQSKQVNNMNSSLPQGQKRKSINHEVENMDPNVKGHQLQANFQVDHDYPMSKDGPSLQPKPSRPNGKGIEQLVKLAIESSASKRLQVQDIYSYIHAHSAYYAQLDRYEPSWHREIRRIISSKSGRNTFRGITPAPGDKNQKSYYWTLVNP